LEKLLNASEEKKYNTKIFQVRTLFCEKKNLDFCLCLLPIGNEILLSSLIEEKKMTETRCNIAKKIFRVRTLYCEKKTPDGQHVFACVCFQFIGIETLLSSLIEEKNDWIRSVQNGYVKIN